MVLLHQKLWQNYLTSNMADLQMVVAVSVKRIRFWFELCTQSWMFEQQHILQNILLKYEAHSRTTSDHQLTSIRQTTLKRSLLRNNQ